MLEVERYTVGAFQVNTWLITDVETGEAAIIDTGESDELVRRLQARRPAPRITRILLTHAHLDHAGALPLLQEAWDVPTWMPRKEQPLFQTLPHQGSLFGMPHLDRPCGRVDHLVDDGDVIHLGQTPLTFFSTPGHTPGQGCWIGAGHAFVGDTLFQGSIGRTDLPLSDPRQAVESLRRLFATWPADLIIHSGHGPDTTLGQELQTNPFLGYLRKEHGISGPPGLRWAPGTA